MLKRPESMLKFYDSPSCQNLSMLFNATASHIETFQQTASLDRTNWQRGKVPKGQFLLSLYQQSYCLERGAPNEET